MSTRVKTVITGLGLGVTDDTLAAVLGAIGKPRGTESSLVTSEQRAEVEEALRQLDVGPKMGTSFERQRDPRSNRTRSNRRRPTIEDRSVLVRWEERLRAIDKIFGKKPDPRRLEKKGGNACFPDAAVPDRTISLPWRDAERRKSVGELPLITEETVAELRRDLKGLSFASPACASCEKELSAKEFNSMAWRILNRRGELPGSRRSNQANFPVRHRVCDAVHNLMGEVAMELQDVAEGEEKNQERKRRIRDRLVADEGRLMADLLDLPGVSGRSELTILINLIFDNLYSKEA
jgi:hypothetical protein